MIFIAKCQQHEFISESRVDELNEPKWWKKIHQNSVVSLNVNQIVRTIRKFAHIELVYQG